MKVRLIPTAYLLVYAAVSLLDLVLTWVLLSNSGGEVYESNPLAQAWLNNYGWAGLLLFKTAAVVMVGTAAALVALHRPLVSRVLLVAACLVTGGVVAYSVRMLFRLAA